MHFYFRVAMCWLVLGGFSNAQVLFDGIDQGGAAEINTDTDLYVTVGADGVFSLGEGGAVGSVAGLGGSVIEVDGGLIANRGVPRDSDPRLDFAAQANTFGGRFTMTGGQILGSDFGDGPLVDSTVGLLVTSSGSAVIEGGLIRGGNEPAGLSTGGFPQPAVTLFQRFFFTPPLSMNDRVTSLINGGEFLGAAHSKPMSRRPATERLRSLLSAVLI